MEKSKRAVEAHDLGTTGYGQVLELQRRLQAARREGKGSDTLLLTEHRPVFTLGRSHPEPNLRVAQDTVRNWGIEIAQAERGGDITYHGPGQLVAYGIIDLKAWDLGVIDYVRGLEETAIGVLGDWGLRGVRSDAGRGVWIDDRKIASVGLNVRRGVTMHGIALNIDPDMSHWELINPCGNEDLEMTSIALEARKQVPFKDVVESFIFHFGAVFACEVRPVVAEPAKTGRRGRAARGQA